MSGLGLVRGRVLALAAAIAAILVSGTWFALTRASAQQSAAKGAASHHSEAKQASQTAAPPLTVVSVTPAGHDRNVNGGAQIRVVFSSALAPDSPLPTMSPVINGTWQRVNSRTIQFVPVQGFTELTHVKLTIPAGSSGVRSARGGLLATPVVQQFRTGRYSTLRLEQLLAQLGYLPLTWQPIPGDLPVLPTDENGQLSAAYSPPAGTFLWQQGYPARLQGFWQAGQPSLILTGAVMAFQSDQHMTMDGVAGPSVWNAMLNAVARGQDNRHGYTYALASEASPETLTVWHNGKVVLKTLANTGIPGRPTVDGTFPVYLKFYFSYMDGINPDGSKYHDPVYFANYFNGGDAVHQFSRYSYGSYQSLGCVELPWAAAKKAYGYLSYGSLVTVTGPVA